MHIAQIAPLTEAVPPKLYGGTERVISWLTEELIALGHDVTLFASGDSVTAAKLDAVFLADGAVLSPDSRYRPFQSLEPTIVRGEADRINRGEDISTRQEDQDAAAEALAAAGEFFDPEAQHDDVEPAAAADAEK